MMELHKGAFTETQLSLLAERSARSTGSIFKSCPFCGGDDTLIKGRLEDHIVGHLRFLALKSLPPVEDKDNEKLKGERADSNGSMP